MATLAFLNHELQTRGVYDSFWNFILSSETGVIGTAAGVTLGITTAALAYMVVIGLVVPLLAFSTTLPIRYISKNWANKITLALYGNKKPAFDFPGVWHFMLMWMLVVAILFIVLEGLRHLAKRLAISQPQAKKQDINNL